MAAAPTDGLSAENFSRFKLLQVRFVQGLPARWRELSAPSSLASRQEALHRLAGGAGSYGFEHISQLAREAEKLSLAGDSVGVDSALALLKSEIDAAVAERHNGS